MELTRLLGRSCVVLVLCLTSACGGGGDNPAAATGPRTPSVAGSYSGSLTWTVNGAPVAVPLSLRLNVAQSGSQLTLTGTLTANGQSSAIPAITGYINETGFFTATSSFNSGPDPECGNITGDATLTFSGNSAQYYERDNTQFCGAWVFSGTLTR